LNLNKVFIIGRVAADPETRNTTTGQNVSTVRMVTNRVWVDRANTKQEQPEFHTVILWGKLSDIADKYVRKGQLIMIEGRLQTRSWDGNDNVKRYRTEIVAESMQLGPKSSNPGSTEAPGGYQAPSKPSFSKPTFGAKSNHPAPIIKEEEIPVINQDDPIIPDNDRDIDGGEIDLKNIPF
jgi:single-strand DNA-binding protein